jgi:N-acetylmuramoyl-L-alanine amidase
MKLNKKMLQSSKYKSRYMLIAAMLLCGCGRALPSETPSSSAEDVIEHSSSITSEEQTPDTVSTSETTDAEPDTRTSSEASADGAEESDAASEEVQDTAPEEISTEEATSETSMVFYNCDDIMYVIKDANIRLAPNLDSAIYDVYTAGTAVQCIAKSEEWYIVSVGTGAYYISASLLSPENPFASTTEESTAALSSSASGEVVGTSTSNGILYTAGSGPLVCIDAGHQGHGNSDTEPNGPGSDTMKAKVTTGTAGVASGLTEAQLNLSVSCQLRDELIARGYNVLMIRESQDVDISNAQRAQMATAAGADIFVRIHANGSDDASVSGVLTMSPTASNPYVAALYASCHSLSACVVDAICAQTGAINRGIYETDTMSGINWTTMPVTIVEMGYMTNPTEDLLMASEDYQVKLVTGIANGIDTYFGR